MKREEIIAALEYVLKPMKMENSKLYGGSYKCPLCKRLYPKTFFTDYEVKYCMNCGQRIEV